MARKLVWPVSVVASVLAAATPPVWFAGQGGDLFVLLAFFPMHFGPLWAAVGCIAFVFALVLRDRVERIVPLRTCLAALVPMLVFVASFAASFRWHAARTPDRLAESMAFCDCVRPRLELHRTAHGGYPENLDQILGSEEIVPDLLAQSFMGYRASDSSFEFRISTARLGLAFRGAAYDSETGEWTVSETLFP